MIVFSWIVRRNRRNGYQPLLMVRRHASLWKLRNPITSLTAKENVVQLSLLPVQQPPLQQLLPQQPQRHHHVIHQEGKDVTGGPSWTWRRRKLHVYTLLFGQSKHPMSYLVIMSHAITITIISMLAEKS